jgi:predicted Zn-dependent peptidase
LQLDFGDAQSLQGQATVSALTARMLMRGAGTLSRAALSSRLDELKAKISVDGGGSSLNVSFETVRQHLPQVLDIVRDIVRAPLLLPTEFELLRKESITQIESQRSDPQAMASQALRRALDNYPAGDVRKVLSFDEILANLRAASAQDVQSFYQDFYGASHAKLTMVGDFDAAAVRIAEDRPGTGWSSGGGDATERTVVACMELPGGCASAGAVELSDAGPTVVGGIDPDDRPGIGRAPEAGCSVEETIRRQHQATLWGTWAGGSELRDGHIESER